MQYSTAWGLMNNASTSLFVNAQYNNKDRKVEDSITKNASTKSIPQNNNKKFENEQYYDRKLATIIAKSQNKKQNKRYSI